VVIQKVVAIREIAPMGRGFKITATTVAIKIIGAVPDNA